MLEPTIAISGPMGLAEAPRWRSELLAAWSEGGTLRVDLSASGPWEFAGLQVVAAALAMARRDGRSLRLIRVPRVFLAIVDRAGDDGRISAAIDDVLA